MNRNEILDAAKAKFGDETTLRMEVFYEHDQWWLDIDDMLKDVYEGHRTYSVVDTSNGIDFEELAA